MAERVPFQLSSAAPCWRALLVRSVFFRVWVPNRKQCNHLGTCQACDSLAPPLATDSEGGVVLCSCALASPLGDSSAQIWTPKFMFVSQDCHSLLLGLRVIFSLISLSHILEFSIFLKARYKPFHLHVAFSAYPVYKDHLHWLHFQMVFLSGVNVLCLWAILEASCCLYTYL